MGTKSTLIVNLESISNNTRLNSTSKACKTESEMASLVNATEDFLADSEKTLIRKIEDAYKEHSLIDKIAHIGARGCIEICDLTLTLSQMSPALMAYAIGLVALVLSARVRSMPENFRDSRLLYALLICIFLIILLFTPLFVLLHDPRLDFIKCVLITFCESKTVSNKEKILGTCKLIKIIR